MHGWNLLRVGVIMFAALNAGAILKVMFESRRNGMSRWQLSRFMSLLVATITISLGEVHLIDKPVTYRTWLALVVVLFGAYGVWGIHTQKGETDDYSSPVRQEPESEPDRPTPIEGRGGHPHRSQVKGSR